MCRSECQVQEEEKLTNPSLSGLGTSSWFTLLVLLLSFCLLQLLGHCFVLNRRVESHLSNPFPGFRYDGPALTINIGADGT